MSQGDIDVAIEAPLAIVTLRRPAKMNALTSAMLEGLARAADRLDADRSVRAVLLTGAGDRAFCGGADIAEWGDLGPAEFGRVWVRMGHRLLDRWAGLRPPVIAVLNGIVLGGGLELAAVADLRIAEAHAQFGLPEAKLGIIPGWAGTQRLTRRVGGQVVRRLALLAEPVDAAEALRLGLVDFVCATGAGLAEGRALGRSIAARAPLSVELVKQLVNAAEGEAAGATMEALAGALAAGSADLAAGLAAFRDKRVARFDDG